MGWVLFSFHLQRSYSLVVSDEVRECTWLGSPMCAAGGGSSTWGNTWESRTLPDSMKKGLTPYGVGSFFHSICNVPTLWSSPMKSGNVLG